ncbi:MAG: hypothetical protein WCS85_03995 [Candidatus Peribacteraceae bacterium]|jgi:hypothetical protein
MLDALPKIDGLSEEDRDMTVDQMETDESGSFPTLEVKRLALCKLLAGRIGEARSLMRRVTLWSGSSVEDAMQRQNATLSGWEFTEALKHGHLEAGLSLHPIHASDHEKVSPPVQDPFPFTPGLLNTCGRRCRQDGDYHNAIASFERAGNVEELLQLAFALERRGDEKAKKYAAIARKSVEEIEGTA